MKIMIAGAGAMGSRFGYMLQEGGNDVTLVDSWLEHVNKINNDGLTLDINGESKTVKIKTVFPKDVTETPDLIILFTKSMGLNAMLTSIKHVIGENTKVLCLLNGLGHVETVEKYIKKENIYMGVTLWTAGLVGPGHVKISGDGNIEIQNIDPTSSENAKTICDVLSASGLKAKYSENVMLSIWRKACVNATLNSCCTLLDCNIKEFGSLSQAHDLIRHIIYEFSLVAKHYNVTLDVEAVASLIEGIYAPDKAGAHYPSMHQDLIQHGRLTEIDYINGFVSKKSKEFGLSTPYNDLITNFVHAKEEILVK